MDKFLEFLGQNGNNSAMRLAFVIGIFTIIAVWAFISLIKMEIQSLDSSLLGVVAVLTGGKIWQKKLEHTNNT